MTEPSKQGERPLDVLVWGATGFTGKLVAEYLADNHARSGLRWGLAGRSLSKLEEVRRGLAARVPALGDLPLVVADARDPRSLAQMVAQTRVICTTVGPYALHGSELVAACIQEGTDYCDLTGEVHWIRRMIDQHHEAARARGARIVHCCGFDSIPSDLGAQMMVEHLREAHGRAAGQVRLVFGPMRGGASGGTIASMLNVIDEIRTDRSLLRVLGNPYGLDPVGSPRGPASPDQKMAVHDDDLDCWTAPFVMAAINTRIVRRSNALLGQAYGPAFRYHESLGTGRGPLGFAKAAGVVGAMVGTLGAASLPPVGALLRRVLPDAGEGPSREQREAGFFRARLVAEADGGPRLTVRGLIVGQRDPGYAETAKMISESAICLALDRDKLTSGGGVLTPASAMGKVLRERLVRAGMTFQVEG